MRRTLVFLAVLGCFATGCSDRDEPGSSSGNGNAPAAGEMPSKEHVKELVSRAAGLSSALFRKMTETGGIRKLEDFQDQPLTLWLLYGKPPGLPGEGLPYHEDELKFLETEGMPRPDALVRVLTGGRASVGLLGYASIIRPPYITELQMARKGEGIDGTVSFKGGDLYVGRVRFTLARLSGRWAVTEFRMPKSGLVVRKNGEGNWRILR